MLLLFGILIAVVGLLGLVGVIPGLPVILWIIVLAGGVCLALYATGVFGHGPRNVR